MARKRYSKQQIKEVLNLLANGYNRATASEKTGIPEGTIAHWQNPKTPINAPPAAPVDKDTEDTLLMTNISQSLANVIGLAKECVQWRKKALAWSAKLVELQEILKESK